ncbi:hypothetical protein ABVT39_018698 [Epinephelus coioides]
MKSQRQERHQCLGTDLAECGVQWPPACKACQVLPEVRHQQWHDNFRCFKVMLHCDESKQELKINDIETCAPTTNIPPPPQVIPTDKTAWFVDDDNILLVSSVSASRRSPLLTSLRQDFLLVMTVP